jgi:hypothetical protein
MKEIIILVCLYNMLPTIYFRNELNRSYYLWQYFKEL